MATLNNDYCFGANSNGSVQDSCSRKLEKHEIVGHFRSAPWPWACENSNSPPTGMDRGKPSDGRRAYLVSAGIDSTRYRSVLVLK